jgi:hypothetical protein
VGGRPGPNHGISGTSSGGGAGGGADRHPPSSPNARAVVNGITRYEAEVLGTIVPQINSGIRTLAAARGIQLSDLAAHTSDDDGVTWRSADLHVGDSLHYTTTVRAWIADLIVAHMRSIAGAAAAASVGQ